MTTAPTGRFWAVGVGPGDPELLTLKAAAILRRVAVVCHAGPREREGRAWEIVRDLVRPEQQVRAVRAEPMAALTAGNGASYRPAVEQIAADCRRGHDVAFITEGDPTLYSTASSIWQLLREIAPEVPVEIVPGVSSMTAAAARVGWPLARKGETLAVVPASYHPEKLLALLEHFSTVCLLKAPAVLPQVAEAVRALGPGREAVYVENVSTDREWMTHDLASAAGREGYFALVLVRRTPEGKAPPSVAGKLWVVGLGPGDPRLLTRQALEALHSAEVVVGYKGYLRMLEPLALRAELRGSPIGAEAERAAEALRLASDGRRVALVSSGDAGVFGMASLLLETAALAPGVDVEVVPGVTAAVAAAALLGAPLGHDFACVSLSDLLTPWDVIERRIEAAGQGELVLALYNPVSDRRTWQLPRARDVLLKYRRPETPVGVVDRAYRPGTRVRLTTLGELTADGVGMETTLIVGSSRTRVVNGRLVTPRGYRDAAEPRALARGKEAPLADARGSDLGRRILDESFALIERELGPPALPPWAFAVARRMIHASADFEFAQALRWSDGFEAAIRTAFRNHAPIITDTEMVLLGIRTALADAPGVTLACYLNNPETPALAASAGLTRSAAGIRLAARRHAAPVLVIGNAPTAVEEALRRVAEEGWRPAAIIGMPVGFVGVEEAKRRLQEQTVVPYLSCVGRKGGSAVAAATANALVEWCQLLSEGCR